MTQYISETALSNAISKLGPMVLCMSVTPIRSCAKDVPCTHDCYACRHAYGFYKETKAAWDRNFALALAGEYDTMTNDIQHELDKGRYPYFRWFVGGDIPSREFFDMMCEIASDNPDIRFLCFTKKYDIIEDHIMEDTIPDNLVVVLSCWKSYRPQKGLLDAFPRAYFNDDTPECDLPYISFQCQGDCVACGHQCWDMQHHDNVIFNKH